MLRTLLMASVAVALSAMSAQADGQPGAEAAVSLKTPVGVVRGTADANGVQSFKGIPYAVPPVGALRWTPARAPTGGTA